jgi:hypothetical protein
VKSGTASKINQFFPCVDACQNSDIPVGHEHGYQYFENLWGFSGFGMADGLFNYALDWSNTFGTNAPINSGF